MMKHNCVFQGYAFSNIPKGQKRGLPQLQQCLYFKLMDKKAGIMFMDYHDTRTCY